MFAWLDYSDRVRRKMLDVVRLFEEKDTVDELGLGTVQTTAWYFFFIPWMHMSQEEKRVPSSRISERARGEAIHIVERGITESVIGNRFNRMLKRLPRNIEMNVKPRASAFPARSPRNSAGRWRAECWRGSYRH